MLVLLFSITVELAGVVSRGLSYEFLQNYVDIIFKKWKKNTNLESCDARFNTY
jgi:hypothetical protein